jgi:hypothetical protein
LQILLHHFLIMGHLVAVIFATCLLALSACSCPDADLKPASQPPYVRQYTLAPFDDWTVFVAVVDQRMPSSPVLSQHHTIMLGAFPTKSPAARQAPDFSKILLYTRATILCSDSSVEYYWLPHADYDPKTPRLLVASWDCGGTAGYTFQVIQVTRDDFSQDYSEFNFEVLVQDVSKTRPWVKSVSPDLHTISLQLTDKFQPPSTLIFQLDGFRFTADSTPDDPTEITTEPNPN